MQSPVRAKAALTISYQCLHSWHNFNNSGQIRTGTQSDYLKPGEDNPSSRTAQAYRA
jgi:hypothetical protein